MAEDFAAIRARVATILRQRMQSQSWQTPCPPMELLLARACYFMAMLACGMTMEVLTEEDTLHCDAANGALQAVAALFGPEILALKRVLHRLADHHGPDGTADLLLTVFIEGNARPTSAGEARKMTPSTQIGQRRRGKSRHMHLDDRV